MEVNRLGEIVLKRSRWKAVVLLSICLAFSCICAWLLWKGDRELETWLVLAFFGGIGIPVAIYSLADRRPRLVINDEGVLDRTLGVGLIPWTAIDGAELWSILGHEFIALRLRDPTAFMMRLNPVARKLAKVARTVVSADFALDLSSLAVRGRDVIRLIHDRCPAPRSWKVTTTPAAAVPSDQ